MSEISKLNGYDLKDATARQNINTLNLVKIQSYQNIQDMKNDTTLVEGQHVKTKGYYEANDEGQGEYIIIDDDTLVEDGGLIHILNNGLRAVLIIDEQIRVKQFGAVGDGITDDTDSIQLAMDLAGSKNKPLVFERNKTYKVDSTRNRIATNGYSTILYSYGALILKGRNVIIHGNNSTLKNTVTQSQYDNNDQTLGAVILISSNEKHESEIGQDNDFDYKNVGQSVTINSLIIDGGSESINQTARQWGQGRNNCIYARGINCIFQPNITMTLNNTTIKNCIAEGISGGSSETSVFVNGGKFSNVFPSPLNLSGGIEILDGCVIENPMAIEMNPSYPKATQIVRNCTIKSTYNDDNAAYCLGAVGLLSTTPTDNSNVIIENNVIDFTYNGSTQYKASIFAFRNLNNLIFKDNIINISTPNFANIRGYGGIFAWGNINKKIMLNNKIKYTLPSTNFNSFSMAIYGSLSTSTFNEEISDGNTLEVTNTLDLSGTNYIAFPDLRETKKDFDYIFHFTAPSSSTTLVYRLMYADNFNQMVMSSKSSGVTLENFYVRGYNSSNVFDSLLDGIGGNDIKIPKQGRIFNLVQTEPNANGESLNITSSALDNNLDFDIKLLCK